MLVENLILAFEARGTTETVAQTEAVSGAVDESAASAKRATAAHTGLGKSFSGMRGAIVSTLGLAGLGGLAVGFTESIKNAEALQESQKQLGKSIKTNLPGAASDAGEQMMKFADSMAIKGGFDPVSNVQALTLLARTAGTVKGSTDALTMSTNLARGAHVSLNRAVRAVMQAEQGHATGLSRLGVAIIPTTEHMDALEATYKNITPAMKLHAEQLDLIANKHIALAAITKKYGGATPAFAHTAAGAINNLRNSIEELSQKFATKLLPYITKAAKFMERFVNQMIHGRGAGGEFVDILKDIAHYLGMVFHWLGQNKTSLKEIAIAIGVIVGAVKLWTAAMAIFDAVADADPMFWVILIVAGLILAYNKFKWFRDFVNEVAKGLVIEFDWIVTAIKNMVAWVENFAAAVQRGFDRVVQWVSNAVHNVINAFKSVITWVKQEWPLIRTILLGPIGNAIFWIVTHWATVKEAFKDLLHWFGGAWKEVKKLVEWPFTEAWKGIKWAVNKMIDGINWVIKALDKLHFSLPFGLGHFGIDIAPVKHMAWGGPAVSGGSFMVGERGPEMITLPGGSYVSPNSQLGNQQLIRAMQDVANRPVVIYNVLDGKVLSQAVVRQGMLQVARGG